jgi:hypothetical protein
MSSSTMPRAAVCIVALAAALATAAPGACAGGEHRAEPVRTAKERLGGKANDEQRVDNCKVPHELRGPKPRPDRCGDGIGAQR